ncbi:hypothetical protein [Burkholderia metallica]|uniref:hypothetical protein n=1 Tax=Burkholderia metallica TaxID=488729 RepID=UPI001CF45E8D|nr:hypothetical protein [Burkholderia metallica]MCA8023622.1 hypothetical protein [Burkholderia metallica]
MTNRFNLILGVQRSRFLSDATKSHEWRIDQLDRMERMMHHPIELAANRSSAV